MSYLEGSINSYKYYICTKLISITHTHIYMHMHMHILIINSHFGSKLLAYYVLSLLVYIHMYYYYYS